MKYVLAIDQSTQGTKVMLVRDDGQIADCRARRHRQLVDENGYVSHDADEIYRNVLALVAETTAAAGVTGKDIAAVGLTNQRETTVLFDARGALAPAVVWQCRRSAEITDALSEHAQTVYDKTGLPLSPYFPAGKMAWLLRHARPQGDFKLGTVDAYLLYRLTGKFVTDRSNASRTQLMDLRSLDWDGELLSLFGLDGIDLPEILPSDGDFGETDFDGLLDRAVPVTAVLGDSHAAFYAHGCHKEGDVKATYGTGTSVMMNIGGFARPRGGLAVSVGWSVGGKTDYVLEGNINYSAAVVGWLESMGIVGDPAATAAMAQAAHPADTTVFVPAFGGLSAPYWRSDVKAAITGMTRVTGRNEVVRAALDSVAFQVNDILSVMAERTGRRPLALCADGGAVGNAYLMQTQSDISGVRVTVPDCRECSAFGAAMLAGKSRGVDLSLGEGVAYESSMSAAERERRLARWHAALEKL